MELISKEALLKQIEEDSEELGRGYYGDEWKWMDTINNMPTIESRPKGRWNVRRLEISENWIHKFYNCSVCGEDAFFDEDRDYLTNYCPHCGADMRGEE